jgi:hypothetical protein
MCGRFGTLCSIFIGGVSKSGVNGSNLLAPPVKMELTECSETSEYKIQTQENYPEESIQHSEHPSHLSVYEDETECSETSAYKIQTPENHSKEMKQK